MTQSRVAACLFAGASLLAIAPAALAQSSQALPPAGAAPQTPPGAVPGTGAPATDDSAGNADLRQTAATAPEGIAAPGATDTGNGDIVVTGSRVIQNGNNSPTPVTVVSTQQLLQTAPSNIQDGLQALPILSGAQSGPQRQPGNSSQNGAAHLLNLRNVGVTRTLILFDGRRLPPTTPTGEVNVDLVPNLLLQRVDIVTGGASAVYGSDAVTGVVNFVMDRGYNGVKIDAQAGVSERGDGPEQRIGIAAGRKLGERGHFEASYEFYNSPGIDTRLGRRFGQQVITVQGAGTTANPYHLVYDTRLSSTSFSGVIKTGPLATVNGVANAMQVFGTNNGGLRPFIHGGATGGSGVESGGDGAYYSRASLLSLFRSHQAFGRFDYELTDNIRFFAEGTGFWSRNRNNHQDNELPRATVISSQNAFLQQSLTPAQRALLVGTPTFQYSKVFTNVPVLQPDTKTRTLFGNAGLSGNLGKFKWEVSYLHADNVQKTSNNNNLDNQHLSAALDAVVNPANGQIVCNVTLTNPGLYPGCVPLNVFGPTTETADMANYILAKTTYRAHTKMDNVGASISGSPFSTWAGDVVAAVSGEYRKLGYSLVSDAQPTPADCTGLRYNCSASTLKYISNVLANRSPVSTSVKEAAVEVDVPLLRDFFLAKTFNVNGAARYTDYNTSGKVTTWKVGIDWHVNDAITIRGTRSRDIRAPTINDLFAPALINPAGTSDLHTGVVGQAPFITQSNASLVPEVALTWTAGIVLRPAFLPRFSLSVDYYKIKINNAITTIQGQDPTIQGICEASNGTSSFCSLIVRPLPFADRTPANTATAYYSQPLNAQRVETNGIDFELNYSAPVGPGTLSLRDLVSYQPHLKTIQFPGAPVLEAANTPGIARWRMTAFVRYQLGRFALDVRESWHNSTWWNSNRTLVYSEKNLPAAAYTNVTLSVDVKPAQFFVSVRNLFDKDPTPFGVVGGSSGVPGLFGGYVPGDDNIGRYFNAGVRIRL